MIRKRSERCECRQIIAASLLSLALLLLEMRNQRQRARGFASLVRPGVDLESQVVVGKRSRLVAEGLVGSAEEVVSHSDDILFMNCFSLAESFLQSR